MVKLPSPNEQPARAVGERGSNRNAPPAPLPPPLLNYSRFRRRRYGEPSREPEEPTGLYQLEQLAKKSVQVMERHNPKSDSNYVIVMDLLRLQYNMNFMVVCEKCGGFHSHSNDELLAPER